METEDTLRIAWVLPASRAPAEVEAIRHGRGVVESEQPFEPSDKERDKYAHAAFEPLTVLIFSFAAGFVADRLSRFVRGMRHGGLIIDLTADPITVREERALDQGYVYVVTKEGVKEISKPEPLDIITAMKVSRGAS
jgi:hypothetical protein